MTLRSAGSLMLMILLAIRSLDIICLSTVVISRYPNMIQTEGLTATVTEQIKKICFTWNLRATAEAVSFLKGMVIIQTIMLFDPQFHRHCPDCLWRQEAEKVFLHMFRTRKMKFIILLSNASNKNPVFHQHKYIVTEIIHPAGDGNIKRPRNAVFFKTLS